MRLKFGETYWVSNDDYVGPAKHAPLVLDDELEPDLAEVKFIAPIQYNMWGSSNGMYMTNEVFVDKKKVRDQVSRLGK